MRKLLLLPLLFILLSCSKSTAVSLQWDANANTDLVTSYKVYRVKGNNATLVTTVSAPTTTAVVTNYLSGNRTVFYVTAVNSAGESNPSSKVTVQH
jgi:fibronectin type 3 domain-containing protein